MAYDPSDPAAIKRLRESIDQSQQQLRHFRKPYYDYWSTLAGPNYGPNKDQPNRVYVNLMEKAHNVYVQKLFAKAPQAMVQTKSPQLSYRARDLESFLNRVIDSNQGNTVQGVRPLRMERETRRWVSSSIAGGPSPMKVGWEQTGTVTDDYGDEHRIGDVFIAPIMLDDWVHDTTAKWIETATYMGHRYRMLLDEARERSDWNPKVRDALKPNTLSLNTKTGDRTTQSIGVDSVPAHDEYRDHVEVWEIYLPQSQAVVTFPVDELGMPGEPLSVVPWRGPGSGPYHFLYYTEIANNAMPLPPSAVWRDMHDLINSVYRKLANLSNNAKTILAYLEGHDEGAERIATSENMEAVAVSDPSAFNELHFNGPDQALMAMLQMSQTDFNAISGNIDLLGGTAAQTGTVGQDELLSEGANARLQDMQDTFYSRMRDVMEHIAWYYHHDPIRTYRTMREVPNTNLTVPVEIRPEDRLDNWGEFNFQVIPHSMQRQTPDSQMMKLLDVLDRIQPMLPMFQQAGYNLDPAELLDVLSRYAPLPELKRIIRPMDPNAVSGEPPIGNPGGAAKTERSYVRKSVNAGPTGPAKSVAMIQSLLGGGSQTQPSIVGGH